jgi:hypothetical protein
MFNWLQKISQHWIGHEVAPGTLLWAINNQWTWKEYITAEKDYGVNPDAWYHHVTHEDIFPNLNASKASGRIDAKRQNGTVTFEFENTLMDRKRQKRVLDICVNKYPGVKWYVYSKGEPIPLGTFYQGL